MMRLFLFNPENDMALALGVRNYTPPPRVAALHEAGALLPAWFCRPGDAILAPPGFGDDAARLRAEYGLDFTLDFDPSRVIPQPWGWSADAVRQFVRAGVPASRLPDAEAIDRMRSLSHRRTSIAILEALGERDLLPAEFTDISDVQSEGDCILKSPWSCSGRGVFASRSYPSDALTSVARGIIHRQGSVMVERRFDRVADFSALFESDGHEITHVGWGLFSTDESLGYCGNRVMSQSGIESHLHGLGVDTSGLALRLSSVLTALIPPYYIGPLGVDMMVYNDCGSLRTHPCIELNLRTTMGFVAMGVHERLGATGLLRWEFESTATGHILLPPRNGFSLILS